MMKKLLKSLAVLLAIMILSTALSACGGGGSPQSTTSDAGTGGDAELPVHKFIISNCELPTNQFNLAYEDMKEYMESTGRFEVTIYNNQEFSSSESECINQVMSNIIQMSQGPTYLVGATAGMKEYYIYDYPFIFENEEACHKLIESDLAQKLADQVKKTAGIIVGKAWVNGWSAIGNSKHPVNTISDLKGLKLRTAETETTLAYMNELEVAAIPMAFTEIYTAVSQGTIDGVVTPLQFFYQSKFGEVCKYITWEKSLAFVQVPYVNAQYVESLDEEARQILMNGMDLFSEKVEEYASERGQDAMVRLKDEMGIEVLIPSQETVDALHSAGVAVQEKYKDIVGAEFFDEVKALLDNA